MARKGYNRFTWRNMLQEVMVDPAGSVVNNSCNQTTTSPKWIIIFFSFSVKGSKNLVQEWLQCLRARKGRLYGHPSFHLCTFACLGIPRLSQVIFDLAIASTSLQRIPREGLRPCNYQAIAYGIGLKQRKIFNYLLKRWYYEFWIDCRLCEMIAHGSSTVITFSSKSFAAKNQKVKPLRSFVEERCLNVLVTNFQRKLKHKDSQILCRFLIFRFKQRQRQRQKLQTLLQNLDFKNLIL